MVITSAECLQVVETVDGDSVVGSVVTDSSSIAGDVALGNIVGSLTTNKEAIATENGVGGKSGALLII